VRHDRFEKMHQRRLLSTHATLKTDRLARGQRRHGAARSD
jgi:hypothetical protein